ncbi:MAG TPA: disulfide bond formation protein B [Caulobacteraceae bacterium]|nr:disulfide bond formation protein B [Caulobacteraceae bacterium]
MSAILRLWPFVMALLAAAMLAVAHAFQTFGHMAPCELCLKEREVWWAVLVVGLVGGAVALRAERVRTIVIAVVVLLLFGSFLLAGYHAGVEWKWWPGPQSCSGSAGPVTIADMRRLLKGGAIGIVRCDQAAWVFLGLSMAGWNAVVSLMAALASLGVALWKTVA